MARLNNIQSLFQSPQWRMFLLIGGMAVVAASVYFTLELANSLKKEERLRMELLALAQRSMLEADPMCDVSFQLEVIEGNSTVPLILVDGDYRILDARNYPGRNLDTDRMFFREELKKLRETCVPVVIESKELPIRNLIYFRQSRLITSLELFPYLQFSLIIVFLILAYLSFSSLRREQQERIWVGMAKETAHQLGTPITSLIGWIENIKAMYPEDENLNMMSIEMYRDVELLEIVAARFSKIGATPELRLVNIYERLEQHYQYIKQRAPRKVVFDFPDQNSAPILIPINALLFDWVIENLLKNALDAMDGKGEIRAEVIDTEKYLYIDISDTGKGIPPKNLKSIFKPGFSTKKRGWGLGLSLCKRIIESYHNGKIFVKESVIGEGTTFRIQLPKKNKNLAN